MWAALFVAGVATGFALKSTPTSPVVLAQASLPGRYQLFQGRYEFSAGKGSITTNAVFRLDSATGEAWVYHEGSAEATSGLYAQWWKVAVRDR